jgi:hypothetical protein
VKYGGDRAVTVNWWLRSPNSNNSNNALYVDSSGIVNNNNVNNALGVRPALLRLWPPPCVVTRPKRLSKWVSSVQGAKEPCSRPAASVKGQTHTAGKGGTAGKRSLLCRPRVAPRHNSGNLTERGGVYRKQNTRWRVCCHEQI